MRSLKTVTILAVFLMAVVLGATTTPERTVEIEVNPVYEKTVPTDPQTGSTADDFNEETDIGHSKTNTTKEATIDRTVSQGVLPGDVIVEETDENYESPEEETKKVVTEFDPETGKVINRVITVKTKTGYTGKVRKVQKFWKSTRTIKGVKEIVLAFVEKYGKKTSEDQFKIFNRIAATDGNRYASSYNYVQTSKEKLENTIRAVTGIFQSPLREEDIQRLYTALSTCDENAQVYVPDTRDIHINGETAWTIYAEMFAATCDKETGVVQMFSFSSSKSGGYIDYTQYSVENFNEIRDILTQWLYRNIGLLFTCANMPPVAQSLGNAPLVQTDA